MIYTTPLVFHHPARLLFVEADGRRTWRDNPGGNIDACDAWTEAHWDPNVGLGSFGSRQLPPMSGVKVVYCRRDLQYPPGCYDVPEVPISYSWAEELWANGPYDVPEMPVWSRLHRVGSVWVDSRYMETWEKRWNNRRKGAWY